MNDVSGYVLAGGKSSRMGADKTLLRLGGVSLAERALHVCQAATRGNAVLVVNQNRSNQFSTIKSRVLVDQLAECGPLGGVYTALTDAPSEWVMILACDYPFVTAEFLLYLRATAEAFNPNVAAVVPVQSDGKPQPLCAFYRVEPCVNALTQLLGNGTTPGVLRLLENVPTQTVEFARFKHLPNAERFFFNVNTPEDFRLAETVFQSSQNSL